MRIEILRFYGAKKGATWFLIYIYSIDFVFWIRTEKWGLPDDGFKITIGISKKRWTKGWGEKWQKITTI